MAIIHTHIPKRKKRKPNAQQRELQASWDALVKKYEVKKVVKRPVQTLTDVYKLTTPAGRETPKYPSVVTAGGSCTKPVHGKVYTGTAMVGIGTLHKSNAVPVFNSEDAVEQARMRRG